MATHAPGAPGVPADSRAALPGLAVMISGGGRTMVNLAHCCRKGELAANVNLVIASRHCDGAERARVLGLPVLVAPGVIDPAVLARMLADHGCGWIVLAGYLKMLRIPPGFEGKAVNIHPALLPSFGGAGMYGDRVHQAVIDAGCKVSGCTVHLCDEAYDRGPIVAQATCEVRDDDTAHDLAARVFALETELYPRALSWLLAGKVRVEGTRTRVTP